MIQDTYNNIRYNRAEEKENQFNPLRAKSLKMYSYEERLHLYNIGMNSLKRRMMAVYLVASGQGTRLGHKGPKGTFKFQLQCERLIYLSNECKRYIPLYIMTSVENHNDTVSFFKEHNYFGYPENMIMFFQQRTMPSISKDGKIILSDKGRIAMSPDGSGGCFLALKESGAFDEVIWLLNIRVIINIDFIIK